MPLIETKGAASAQGFGEFLQQSAPIYIENVFSTWLYTGNGSTQTITNGIDLSGKGGLVWIKNRNSTQNNWLFDTVRGSNSPLSSNRTSSVASNISNFFTGSNYCVAGSSGFTLGNQAELNTSSYTYASWTFREQPKFFDVVTYTGTGSATTISHNLGSTPGCIIVKRVDAAADWIVYHRSLTSAAYSVQLNLIAAQSTTAYPNVWNNTAPTSTVFSIGDDPAINTAGSTYVAYLFAHNAGGFGLSGTDNVISCGSFTTDGSANATINLGYEPQWVLIKPISRSDDWKIFDTMRGWISASTNSANYLLPNTSGAEGVSTYGSPNATGFTFTNASNETSIYIAIRRGPMKVPTSGTSVFVPITYTGSGTAGTVRTTGIVTDMVWSTSTLYGGGVVDYDRLRGAAKVLQTGSAGQEQNEAGTAIGLQGFDLQDGYYAGPDQGSGTINYSGYPYVNWVFRRAPKFFDEVCYTGDGGATKLINHNLGVAPELLIVKIRNGSDNWWVYNSSTGSGWRVRLNASSSEQNDTAPKMWGTTFSSTQFQVGDNIAVNNNATNYVAYLFATCPGVSKVGTYTGTGPGTLITVNCGFTSGARFVLIRRLYGGDWYVYDSARGISSGSDPYLTLNGYSAQTTGTNYVDTTSVGFQVTAAAPYELNTNGLTFLFLAIA